MNIDINMIRTIGFFLFALLILRIYFLFITGSKTETIAETDTDDVILRARKLAYDGMHNELQRYVKKELMTKYQNTELRRILADSYYKTGKHSAAAKNYEALLVITPDDYELKLLLAHSLRFDKQVERAIQFYEEIVAANPLE